MKITQISKKINREMMKYGEIRDIDEAPRVKLKRRAMAALQYSLRQ